MKRVRLTEADRDRVGQVFEEHRGYVEALAVQHAGREDAPDIVAEVGLRLCTHLNGLRDRHAIRTFIYRITVSVAMDWHRDRSKLEATREHIAQLTNPHDAVLEPDEYLRDTQRRDAFLEVLDRMKSRDKRLICNTLGLARVSVTDNGAADRVALHRAKQRLRILLLRDPRFRNE